MTNIVGILNITPDSFSDGGNHYNPDLALKHAERLIKDGANIIDIGAESTRPGAIKIDIETELSRLTQILPDVILLAHKNSVQVSIDTYKPKIAEFALSYGIDFINDITGFFDIDMINLAVNSNKKIIVMHNSWILEDKNINKNWCINEIINWAKLKINDLEAHQVKRNNIIIDPGIGFGKTDEQSWDIINHAERLNVLGVKTYIGHSRKRCMNLDDDNKLDIKNRDTYTVAVSAMLAWKNIDYIRVHNVSLHRKLFNKFI